MSRKPMIKLYVTGNDEYVIDAFAEIYDTYKIDRNIVTKGTRDHMSLEFIGDRAVCMVPLYHGGDTDIVLARAWYIISRWDVTSIVCNGMLVRDLGDPHEKMLSFPCDTFEKILDEGEKS